MPTPHSDRAAARDVRRSPAIPRARASGAADRSPVDRLDARLGLSPDSRMQRIEEADPELEWESGGRDGEGGSDEDEVQHNDGLRDCCVTGCWLALRRPPFCGRVPCRRGSSDRAPGAAVQEDGPAEDHPEVAAPSVVQALRDVFNKRLREYVGQRRDNQTLRTETEYNEAMPTLRTFEQTTREE
eukprot:jgi/Tetstr1/431238/TSEL_002057.t1